MTTLSRLSFDNHFARLGPQFSTAQPPVPVPEPFLASVNPDVAALIDLDPVELHTAEFLRFASGHWLPPGSDPVAMIYGGHQFGRFVPELGGGREVLIGQVRNRACETWDVELKSSPDADSASPSSPSSGGAAAPGSVIREYLGSEALHHLGIPTTRALAIAVSDLPAVRDGVETAGALLRVAPSLVRFGSFEVFHYRQQPDRIRTLADYVIGHWFPEVTGEPGTADAYFGFLHAVVVRTARSIAQWQAAGFAHGLMNTDSMSILGIALDLGPFGFVEAYDPDLASNPSDDDGRYALSNQPAIGFWNLSALAHALTSLLPVERRQEALSAFEPEFSATLGRLMGAKLGLVDPRDEDESLINGLLEILRGNGVDYTRFFRALSDRDPAADEPDPAIPALFRYPEAFALWDEGYRARLAAEGVEPHARRRSMRAVNPKYVLRDWMAVRAIERAARKDLSEIDRLLDVLRHPYEDQPGMDEYARPEPARSPAKA